MAHRDLIRENSWMFDHQPAAEEIEPLLKEVPAWHGAPEGKTMADYQGFVVSIKQKIAGVEVWRLYTTVAGKLAILHDAHMVVPDEMKTKGIVPLVERLEIEYKNSLVIIKGTMESPIYGTVFETGTGVMGAEKGADSTNPVENAMTSWRGRAASALCGAGVLPYTGIASAEEVQTAQHRDEMLDRGHNVITLDASLPDVPRSNPARKALDRLQITQKWDADKMESIAQEVLKQESITPTGTALEYIVSTFEVLLVNKMLQWAQLQK